MEIDILNSLRGRFNVRPTISQKDSWLFVRIWNGASRRSRIHLAAVFASMAALLLSGCVTPRLAQPSYPTLQLQPWVKGDTCFYIDDENKAILVKAGAPPEWMSVKTPRGWQLSPSHEKQIADILIYERNPGIKMGGS